MKLGKTKLATLFFEAKRHGFNLAAHKAKPVDATELERRRVDRAAREAKEQADDAARHAATAAQADRIWSAADSAPLDHPYLVRKSIGVGGLRIYHGNLTINEVACDGALIVPARDASGKLWTCPVGVNLAASL